MLQIDYFEGFDTSIFSKVFEQDSLEVELRAFQIVELMFFITGKRN